VTEVGETFGEGSDPDRVAQPGVGQEPVQQIKYVDLASHIGGSLFSNIGNKELRRRRQRIPNPSSRGAIRFVLAVVQSSTKRRPISNLRRAEAHEPSVHCGGKFLLTAREPRPDGSPRLVKADRDLFRRVTGKMET